MRCEKSERHRHRGNKEGYVKEALEHIPEIPKVPHHSPYGKMEKIGRKK